MSGFKKFLLRGNVVDLAVAVVIGAAFGAVVTALVKDIITPIIGMFGGVPDFSAWAVTVNGSKFMIGDFINALLAFVVLAAVVYFMVVLPLQKFMDRSKPATEPAPETKACPRCLSKIPKAANRCAFCASDLDGFEHEHEVVPPTRGITPAR
jgi:large conductance mechanosensitive channel